MVVKKEEPVVLNDVFISIQGLIFVSTWMGMTNLNNLASLSMDASMGSWVGIPSTSVIYVKELCELNQTWREALNLYNQLIFYSNRH